jgi:hypothetical protein
MWIKKLSVREEEENKKKVVELGQQRKEGWLWLSLGIREKRKETINGTGNWKSNCLVHCFTFYI